MLATQAECRCAEKYCDRLNIYKISEGLYRIGDRNVFIRLFKNRHVMVRVGGGWDTLEHYLIRHDPCRGKTPQDSCHSTLTLSRYRTPSSSSFVDRSSWPSFGEDGHLRWFDEKCRCSVGVGRSRSPTPDPLTPPGGGRSRLAVMDGGSGCSTPFLLGGSTPCLNHQVGPSSFPLLTLTKERPSHRILCLSVGLLACSIVCLIAVRWLIWLPADARFQCCFLSGRPSNDLEPILLLV